MKINNDVLERGVIIDENGEVKRGKREDILEKDIFIIFKDGKSSIFFLKNGGENKENRFVFKPTRKQAMILGTIIDLYYKNIANEKWQP